MVECGVMRSAHEKCQNASSGALRTRKGINPVSSPVAALGVFSGSSVYLKHSSTLQTTGNE